MNNLIRIKIIGAGPTGAICSLLLAKYNCTVDIFENKTKEELIATKRAYALTHSSQRILSRISLWNILKNKSNHFESLIVKDSCINQRICFDLNDLKLENKKSNAIGWIISHQNLMISLIKEIENNSQINLILNNKIDNNISQKYDLVLAADGVNSFTRKKWGIKQIKFNYNQACMALKVLIRGANNNRSFEIFRKEGPFAILPMGNNIFQIVWTGAIYKCKDRMTYSKARLLDELATILPSEYEPDCLIEDPLIFPVGFSLTFKPFQKNVLLIGESSHSFHPVGGQGLNLCLRDVMFFRELLDIFQRHNINVKYLPFFHTFFRFLDVFSIAVATDGLIRIFTHRKIYFYPIRYLSFYILSKSKILRRFILSKMTNGF
tara:strand:+ start:1194 stop:2327 length:1134 start_codon:yes stop_codon:yes gene_type:complete